MHSSAFNYLRVEAREAHLAGDGLRVNHLSAIALSQFLHQPKEIQLNFADIKWACILSLHWLAHDFMLREIQLVLERAKTQTGVSSPLHDALRAYFWFIQQPLVPIEDGRNLLDRFSFEWCKPEAEDVLEDCVLISHLLEILWWHSKESNAWLKIADEWQTKCPQWHIAQLKATRDRLILQTGIAYPWQDPSPPEIVGSALEQPSLIQAKLWSHLLRGDWQTLDKEIQEAIATGRSTGTDARLLFDLHHWNRFRGNWGDPQSIGLTRRLLQVTDSPALLFHRLRVARRSELLANFYREGREEAPVSRFDLFRLLMLEELAALSLWSWGDWIDAVRAQAQGFSEVSNWAHDAEFWAVRALLHAVIGGSATGAKNKPEIQRMLQPLELASKATLNSFVTKLLGTHFLHKRGVWDLLHALGDLIPEEKWESVLTWQLTYLHELQLRKDWDAPGPGTLNLWGDLLPHLTETSPIWVRLKPEALRIAALPYVSRPDDGGFFEAWMQFAPIGMAKEIGNTIAQTTGGDDIDHEHRNLILGNAELKRNDLVGLYREKLIAEASTWKSKLQLHPLLSADQKSALMTSAKPKLIADIENFLVRAVPPATSKTYIFPLDPPHFVREISWAIEELPLLEKVVGAIENPGVVDVYIPALLDLVSDMLSGGPIAFAEYVAPKIEQWLAVPARLSLAQKTSGLASLFTVPVIEGAGSIKSHYELGHVLDSLLPHLGAGVSSACEKWFREVAQDDSFQCAPTAVWLALRHSSALPLEVSSVTIRTAGQLLLHLGILASVLDKKSYILSASIGGIVEALHGLPDKKSVPTQWKSIMDWFLSASDEMARSRHNSTRFQVAKLAGLLSERGIGKDSLPSLLERLADDNRASIRQMARSQLVQSPSNVS